MNNPYKRTDIFRCNQDAHRSFEGRVSVYHVIKEKGCYPQGCLYFLWHCSLLEKGNRCIQGYNYIGKNCKGCTYYMEEKVHLQPFLQVGDDEYIAFQDELEEFETWLDTVRYRIKEIAGKIYTVKPWVEKIILPRETHIKLRGYLLVLKKGFIGLDAFNNTFYIRVSEKMMKEYRFLPKMKIELRGEIREDRGRIFVHRPRSVHLLNKGWGRPLTREKVLVAIKTATIFREQPEHCLKCPWGILVDVKDRSEHEIQKYRHLYCLKAMSDHTDCYCRKLN
ncbi:hypothetical protein BVY01_02385 [bacterium I07]|nr:hypothetical protein BVY01_02385 [bacterium I07]